MSGSSRSRQKRKLEPISIEELAGTTGMSGFCTFLTRDTSVAVPALDQIESSAPASAAPEIPAPETTVIVIGAPALAVVESSAPVRDSIDILPETTAPEPPAAISSAAETSALDIDGAESSALDYVFQRRIRIRETSTVQDGHSLAEQAVYDAMYRAGKPHQGDSRILTIGLRTLAELSRMAYSNCKANVRSLIAKLAIEERGGFSYTDGRTYVIFSFREILRRRKAAGLTHVIRNRGVAFVDPASGKPFTNSSISISSAPDSAALNTGARIRRAPASAATAPPPDRSSAPSLPQSSAPATPAHIENRHLLRKNTKEASSFLAPIVSTLRRYIPDVDDDAAVDLWNRCLENAPTAQVAEVVYFVDLKAGKPGIRMPLGFLLTAVPKCFVGDSYRQFHEGRQRAHQADQSRDRMFAEEILRSPEADEEQKQWAREVLSGAS
jgi:hypothetical protein